MQEVDDKPTGGYDIVQEKTLLILPCIIVRCVAAVVGTCGNTLILLAIAKNKRLRNMESVLVVNLTLSDLYVTGIADPMSIVAKFEGEQFFDTKPGLCRIIASMCTISCVASMMTIAVMSINRYFYICKQETYRIVFTKRKTICICISLYGIGTMLVSLNSFGIGNHRFDPRSLECMWDRMATFPYTVAFSVFLVWIPSIITGIFFLKIFLHVRKHQRKIIDQRHSNPSTILDYRSVRLAKTLCIIYAVFVICWTPYALLIVIDCNDDLPYELHLYITMIAHLHPSLNWLVYYLTNRNFADAFKQIMSQVLRRTNVTPVITNTSEANR